MKCALFVVLMFVYALPAGAAEVHDGRDKAQRDSLITGDSASVKIDSLLAFAEKYLGCPYGYGQCGPRSFDCSGFVQHVFGKFGITLPHGSGTQAEVCESIGLKKVVPGDLLFFSGRKVSKKNIGHVAIVHHLDGDKVYMIHATVQAGVILEEMHGSDYFSRRFIKAGRIRPMKE